MAGALPGRPPCGALVAQAQLIPHHQLHLNIILGAMQEHVTQARMAGQLPVDFGLGTGHLVGVRVFVSAVH